MSRAILIGASLLGHVALAVWLGEIRVDKVHAATAIEVVNASKPPPPPPPPLAKIEEPPPPKRQPTRQAPPEAAPEPVPETPQATESFDALPDFGLSLGGDVGGGGIAVPRGRGPVAAQAPTKVTKELGAPKNDTPIRRDECTDPPAKPKPISVPQPAYTDQARLAGIEGRVRVQLTVDEQGQVVDVQVLQGLGHGLDEAALNAARRARFEPAVRCGRATRATFTISMRFSAG